MTFFPLTIFPDGGLVSSIITTVWVGVFVLCFFNLRFGWVLSGLVVPGYIVPLLIVKPVAAAVIVIEAIITFALVWLFSEKLSRGRYPALFGRDRFMGLILASIAVRLVMDGYLLPEFAGWLEDNFDRRFDWQDNLQSFGLVIISLLANQFWKPGLVRGVGAAIVTIGLTYLIVRFGLMEFTNFRMSGVTYMYEGLASSILASPKAYIILTLTAMIASHMNVRYGWDFSGILIPALIALQWYQPTKIITSFAEAIVIYVIARAVLKLPFMANVTLEGGRKLLLFFNISFAWKMLIGWIIVWQGFDVKTTDFYGFGYLLSTLIAIKAHDKDIFPRLARSTLQVSLLGAVFGNIVGFTLSAAVSRGFSTEQEQADARSGNVGKLDLLLVEAIGDAHVRRAGARNRPLSDDAGKALERLVGLLEAGAPASAPDFDMSADGWRLVAVEGGKMAIVRDDGAGRELLVFNPAAKRNLAVAVPDPTTATGLGLAGAMLQANQDARWLVIGSPSPATAIRDAGVLPAFERATVSTTLVLEAGVPDSQPSIAFANAAAGPIDLAALRTIAPGLSAQLQPDALGLDSNRATLALDQTVLDAFLSAAAPALRARTPCRLIASGAPATGWQAIERLAFLRYEIAVPLVDAALESRDPVSARASAQMGGFGLGQCNFGARGHWTLFSANRDEGQVFLAIGQPLQRSVLTWRSAFDTVPARIGVSVHNRWPGDALFVTPKADKYSRSPATTLDVVWQEVVRRQVPASEPLTFHLRPRPLGATGFDRQADLVVARDRLGTPPEGFERLLNAIRAADLRPAVSDGSKAFAGYEAHPAMAERYFGETSGRRFTVGWVLAGRGEGER